MVTVTRGDTLHSISRRHGVQVDEVKAWNGLRSNTIFVGQKLVVSPPEPEPQPDADPTGYVVRKGDTLSEIALRFDVSVAFLRQLNGLKNSQILVGQKLKLRPTITDEATYVVQRNDTLLKISRMVDMPLSTLRELNGIEGSRIYVGQKLRVKSVPAAVHVVEHGDALWEIARAYGTTVEALQSLNGIRGSRIYPGQQLKLPGPGAPRTTTYTVRRGDSLSEIAQLHQMSLAELRKMNELRGSVIHPGQKLKVRPILGPGNGVGGWLHPDQIDWASLSRPPSGVRSIVAENGPYFFRRPRAKQQRHQSYFEGSPVLPYSAYQNARRIFKEFDARVDRLGRLSRDLEGWHIVLDPGHGGQDPGTIVPTGDGNGSRLYIVEDEYVYDIALRMYVLLRLHGADVTMTVLSPNHLLRGNEPPARTFVHEKNEVYNHKGLNRTNRSSAWPHGGYRGLKPRVDIAEAAFEGVPRERTIFVSLHADNSPRSSSAPAVLYYGRSGHVDQASRRFAERLLPALGAGSKARPQRLSVLHDNPASVKVLVEIRNLAYAENAWALRYEQLRQRDAEKLVKGILDHTRTQSLTAAR
jgi:LysM repeat protein/N-acetylmuramoyl-L-alanine amidase